MPWHACGADLLPEPYVSLGPSPSPSGIYRFILCKHAIFPPRAGTYAGAVQSCEARSVLSGQLLLLLLRKLPRMNVLLRFTLPVVRLQVVHYNNILTLTVTSECDASRKVNSLTVLAGRSGLFALLVVALCRPVTLSTAASSLPGSLKRAGFYFICFRVTDTAYTLPVQLKSLLRLPRAFSKCCQCRLWCCSRSVLSSSYSVYCVTCRHRFFPATFAYTLAVSFVSSSFS